MIFGHLKSTQSYEALLAHRVWQLAFEQLQSLNERAELGLTELLGPKLICNVHTYLTKPISECRFESHRHTIDLQYVISGGELIQWAPTWTLAEDGDYEATRDFQYHRTPAPDAATQVHLSEGCFAIFFPNDAHRPMIQDSNSTRVLKAVVKIDRSLLLN